MAPVFQREMCLERAEADAVHGFERLTEGVERLAFLDADALGNQLIHLAHVFRIHAHRQTDLAEYASGTTGSLVGECDSCEHRGRVNFE